MADFLPEGDGSRKGGMWLCSSGRGLWSKGRVPRGGREAGEKRVSRFWLMFGPVQTRGLAPCRGEPKGCTCPWPDAIAFTPQNSEERLSSRKWQGQVTSHHSLLLKHPVLSPHTESKLQIPLLASQAPWHLAWAHQCLWSCLTLLSSLPSTPRHAGLLACMNA